jgi:hypothetical protein
MPYCSIGSSELTTTYRQPGSSPVSTEVPSCPARTAARGATTAAVTRRQAQNPGMMRRKRCQA